MSDGFWLMMTLPIGYALFLILIRLLLGALTKHGPWLHKQFRPYIPDEWRKHYGASDDQQ